VPRRGGRPPGRARSCWAASAWPTRADHRPAALSGGEQQRVAFCRALANAPQLLLADEPTGNLDPATSDQVFGVLMELVREHRAGGADRHPQPRAIDGRTLILSHGGPMPLFGMILGGDPAVIDAADGTPVITKAAVVDIAAWLAAIQE
jgi:hypothetical protein